MKNIASFAVLAIVSVTAFSPSARANAQANTADYYKLQPLSVKEVQPTSEEIYSVYDVAPPAQQSFPKVQALDLDWGTIITIGEKVWQIVEAGKPVTNITPSSVSVVPAGLTSWQQLSGWQVPITKVYSVTAKNLMGLTVIDLRLKVSAMYGGGFDGRGKFLANVTTVPTSVYVLWGFTCNVWSEHQDAVNMGSIANPVAGLGFDIRYQYGSVANMVTGAQDYFVTGEGAITQMQ